MGVKLDSELSGVSWDEVRPLDESAPKAAPAVLNDVMKKIQEDAQAVVQKAKDEALSNLKIAVESVRLLNSLDNAKPEAFKEAKTRVAAAIKSAQENGVSQEELIAASSAMGKAKEEEEKKAQGKEERVKKVKKELPV